MSKEKKEEEIILYLEMPSTEILGVFGDDIHLKVDGFKGKEIETKIEHAVLIISEFLYFQQWQKWLKGKRDYCERFNHYCGVMGYVHPIDPKEVGETTLNIWNEEKEEMEHITVAVYRANSFTEVGFEHG